MALQSNLGIIERFGYVVAGAGIAAWGLCAASSAWDRLVMPLLGGLVLLEGAIGF